MSRRYVFDSALPNSVFLTGLARFKPNGFNRGLNHGLNQVVFFLKKPIGFSGFGLLQKHKILFLGLKFLDSMKIIFTFVRAIHLT